MPSSPRMRLSTSLTLSRMVCLLSVGWEIWLRIASIAGVSSSVLRLAGICNPARSNAACTVPTPRSTESTATSACICKVVLSGSSLRARIASLAASTLPSNSTTMAWASAYSLSLAILARAAVSSVSNLRAMALACWPVISSIPALTSRSFANGSCIAWAAAPA